ncbi:hypothetical protein F4679DRAFT_288692 [Xylaria curta]|nr:hypothetical protein F4679DRAFT_288692 [Xylaria curta]
MEQSDQLATGSTNPRSRNSGQLQCKSFLQLAPSQPWINGVQVSGTSQSQGIYNSTALRSTASRFSLNEHFASTRRDYEFGYDDASSIWEPSDRGTIRSRQLDETDDVGAPFTNSEETSDLDLLVTSPPLRDSDFYDTLCVSHESSAEDIRRAYLRLFSLLDPNMQPPYLRQVAEDYFMTVQTAFETLVNPCKRIKYELESYEGALANIHAAKAQVNHDRIALMRRCLAIIATRLGIWELNARFDSQRVKYGKHDTRRGGNALKLTFIEMNHVVSIDMTELDWKIYQMVQRLQQYSASSDTTMNKAPRKYLAARRLGGTVMTLRGSVHGLLQTPFSFDQQLSSAQSATRSQLGMLNAWIRPLLAVNLRHVIPCTYLNRSMADDMQTSILENGPNQEETVFEVESMILPNPPITARLQRPIVLPFDKRRSLVLLEAERGLPKENNLPRLTATLERPTAGGWLLFRIASGDWHRQPDETSGFFAGFTKIRRSSSLVLLGIGPDGTSPQVEIAFKSRSSFESQEPHMPNRSRDEGICALGVALDNDEKGTWTVSASAKPQYYSVSAKYSRDINLSALWLRRSRAASPETRHSLSEVANNTARRRFRAEAEIGIGSYNTRLLAFRCLKRVGLLSKAGFEMGFGTYSLYLSVYWSRLDRRINVPFFICSRSRANFKTLLLTTLVPFASFALWELWDQYRYRKRRKQRLATLQGWQYTQKRRSEADTLASLMAPAVERRQRSEARENGLVILSAKYGIKARGASDATAWGAAEVADVTIPVAALVDRNRLLIPSGVRKSYILGFWDPDQAEEKVLHIRYSYQGKEATIEVRGDDEQLVLPPPSLL